MRCQEHATRTVVHTKESSKLEKLSLLASQDYGRIFSPSPEVDAVGGIGSIQRRQDPARESAMGFLAHPTNRNGNGGSATQMTSKQQPGLISIKSATFRWSDATDQPTPLFAQLSGSNLDESEMRQHGDIMTGVSNAGVHEDGSVEFENDADAWREVSGMAGCIGG